jgi:hypothetical protein
MIACVSVVDMTIEEASNFDRAKKCHTIFANKEHYYLTKTAGTEMSETRLDRKENLQT